MLKFQKRIIYGLFFAWIILQSLRLIFSLVTYDEVHFLQISLSNLDNLSSGKLVPNYEGFGSAFWLLYSLLSGVFYFLAPESYEFVKNGFNGSIFFNYTNLYSMPHLNIIFMRFTVFSLMVLLIFRIHRLISTKFSNLVDRRTIVLNYLLLLILFTSPIMWWSGKIASPEYLAIGLTGLSMTFLIEGKYKYAVISISTASGFKSSALPILIVILSYVILEMHQSKFRKPQKSSQITTIRRQNPTTLLIYAILPFLIINPLLLINPKLYISNIPSKSVSFSNIYPIQNLMQSSQDFLFADFFAWDSVRIAGLTFWSGFSLFLVAIWLCYFNKNLFLLITVLVFNSFVILLTGTFFYPWYEFPLIVCVIILSLQIIEPTKKRKNLYSALTFKILVIFMLITITFNIFNSSLEVKNALFWNKELRSAISPECTDKLRGVKNYIDQGVIGYSTKGLAYGYDRNSIEISELITNKEKELKILTGHVSSERYTKLLEEAGYRKTKSTSICNDLSLEFYELK